jgi:carbon storage regulator
MLVLTRKKDESILIGNDIEIRINKVDGDGVRLGIIAPRQVPVYRKEIHDLISKSNRDAARASARIEVDISSAKKALTQAPFKHKNR